MALSNLTVTLSRPTQGDLKEPEDVGAKVELAVTPCSRMSLYSLLLCQWFLP